MLCGLATSANHALQCVKRLSLRVARRWNVSPLFVLCVSLLLCLGGYSPLTAANDNVFIYSSVNQIRGLNLTRSTDLLLTTSPVAAAANALAFNTEAGFVYYGDDTAVYRWDPALGAGPVAHTLMMDFDLGPVTAPITELNSAGGSYLDGTYFVGSESPTDGTVRELWALDMSLDGTQVVSATALGLLDACNCTPGDLGGFGDIAALEEGGTTVIFGATTGLSAGTGSVAGRWRFVPSTGEFTLLAPAANGQMSRSLDNRLFSNVGNDIREVDTVTGQTSGTTLFTTSVPIYDFTAGYVIDFGDAPDSYGAAFHRQNDQTSDVRVGLLGADNESGTLNATTGQVSGSGDDNDGTDDEDAISGTPVISQDDGTYTVALDCSVGTRVAGWVDLDRSGTFETSERNANHPAECSSGSVSLEWPVLSGLVPGDSYLRLRASTNIASISSPVGVASDGEVEDHPVVLQASTTTAGSCPVGSVATQYSATDVPIPMGRGVSSARSVISVPDNVTITDVNVVDLVGDAFRINDLQFTLSHAGASSTLYGRSCGREDDYFISLDDESSGTPPCPPTDGGAYPPVSPLSVFDGQSSSGDWVLTVTDARPNRSVSTLNGWTLELCAAVASNPEIRLGKAAQVTGRDVNLTFIAENTGDSALIGLSLIDALDPVFGSGAYVITSPPSVTAGPVGFTGNSAFDGASNTELLGISGVLAPGQSLTIELVVTITAFPTVPYGEYENSATITATSVSDGSQINDVSNDGLDLDVDGSAPTPIVLNSSARLAGRVFLDTGQGATLAHDGIVDSGEVGLDGRVVDVLGPGNGVIVSTITLGDGSWSVDVPTAFVDEAVTVRLQPANGTVSISESTVHGSGAVDDGSLSLMLGAGVLIEGIDFGVIGPAQLDIDRSVSADPGGVVVLPHVYVSPTYGDVSLALTPQGATSGSGRVAVDDNCNGAIDVGELTAPSSIAVVHQQTLCLLVEIALAADVAPGSTQLWQLDASLAPGDDSGAGHSVLMTVSNRDTITVLLGGAGILALEKSVSNVTRGEGASTANSALPGETLEYRLTYQNTGDAALPGLIVTDAAPPFTTIVPGSGDCGVAPAGMSCSHTQSSDLLDWTFTGELGAGQSGVVSYRVTVD